MSTIRLARRNVARTPLRSTLAGVGIAIGVIAIASLGIAGVTLQRSATDALGEVGNEVIVSPTFDAGVERLTDYDVRRIRRATGDDVVVPVKQRRVVVTRGSEQRVVIAYGVDDPARVFDTRSGRIPRPLRSGVLLGDDLADQLGARPGTTVRIDGESVRVRAVLDRRPGLTAVDPAGAVVLPTAAVNTTGYSRVLVVAEHGAAANASAQAIRSSLNARDRRVEVLELASVVDRIESFFDVLRLFLIAIGSIALVVAGISILNVMLMSTVERREEIGVLRAVGFHRRDVLSIVLAEAALLGVGGGFVGIVVSLGVGIAVNAVAFGTPTLVFAPRNLLVVIVAFGVGVITSLVGGAYPAWRAATDHPVDALDR